MTIEWAVVGMEAVLIFICLLLFATNLLVCMGVGNPDQSTRRLNATDVLVGKRAQSFLVVGMIALIAAYELNAPRVVNGLLASCSPLVVLPASSLGLRVALEIAYWIYAIGMFLYIHSILVFYAELLTGIAVQANEGWLAIFVPALRKSNLQRVLLVVYVLLSLLCLRLTIGLFVQELGSIVDHPACLQMILRAPVVGFLPAILLFSSIITLAVVSTVHAVRQLGNEAKRLNQFDEKLRDAVRKKVRFAEQIMHGTAAVAAISASTAIGIFIFGAVMFAEEGPRLMIQWCGWLTVPIALALTALFAFADNRRAISAILCSRCRPPTRATQKIVVVVNIQSLRPTPKNRPRSGMGVSATVSAIL